MLPKKFVIITNHRSLKYILDRRLATTFQQKWLVKLMEFDFCIEYKQGQENLVADALSRGSLVECNVVFVVQLESDMLTRIKASWQSDLDVQKLISELQSDSNSHKHFSWVRGN